jgi:hypothetical protein
MQALRLRIIDTTRYAWDLQAYLPVMLRSADKECQTLQDSSRGDVCSNRASQKCSEQGSNLAGIEITTTSFYNKGWEY